MPIIGVLQVLYNVSPYAFLQKPSADPFFIYLPF